MNQKMIITTLKKSGITGTDNSEKSEMLKDIFSFTNIVHNEDCFLIFGIEDKTHKVVGVENDPNRYNTQQITDWFIKLPIEPISPEIKLQTIKLEEHQIKVMIIKNTDNVPVFLSNICKGKGYGKHPIFPGQIFTRIEDTNTAIDSTASYNQVKITNSVRLEDLVKQIPVETVDDDIEENGYCYPNKDLSDTNDWKVNEINGNLYC